MSEILSQDEVNALIGAVSTGEVGAASLDDSVSNNAVKPYDFKRPSRVSKDQVRTLEMIHDSFARVFTTTLSYFLRTVVEVNLIGVDQLSYTEFMLSLNNPTSLNMFSMSPLDGLAILEINPTLAFSILDRVMGGQGKPIDEVRTITDIEVSIISKVVGLALKDLKEVWSNVVVFDFALQAQETNPQFVQLVAPGEIVILVNIEVRLGESIGVMTLCFPCVVLESITSKLSVQHGANISKTTETGEGRNLIEQNLMGMNSSVSVNIGEANLTIQEILNLEQGDVVRLNAFVQDDFVLRVGDQAKFLCCPGLYGGKRAIKVTGQV